jgi:hypothetical protein
MSTDPFIPRPDSIGLPWTDSPFFERLVTSVDLDSRLLKLVRDFAQNGYVVIDPEIPPKVLDGAVRDLRDRFQPGSSSYYSDDRRVQDAWNFSDNVRAVATAPRVIELLKLLYRRPPIPFQTLNFRIGSEQRTHSDVAFFDSIPHRFMCGVWVALEDIDESNGPLRYYPESHKLPLYNLFDLGIVASSQTHALENLSRYEDFVEALIGNSPFQEQRLSVQKGEALIWAANLYHGGSPILDAKRTRFSQVTHYYFGGCLYYTPLMSDPGLGKLSPRDILNVEYGRPVPQYYHGRVVENPGEWPPRLGESAPILDPMEFPTRVPRSAANAVKRTLDILKRR